MYRYSIIKRNPRDSTSSIKEVKLEKQHILYQPNRNYSQNLNMFMLNEPRLLYIPILKGSLLYDSHHLIHYLPDYTPSHVKDFSYNPSYQPQIFMKGLKSNLSTHGSMGRIMALSTCGEFVYIKKSINCIMRIDLQAKLNSRSNRAEKKSSYRMELHTDNFYIVDFRPLPGSEKLLILGNKCELRIYEF